MVPPYEFLFMFLDERNPVYFKVFFIETPVVLAFFFQNPVFILLKLDFVVLGYEQQLFEQFSELEAVDQLSWRDFVQFVFVDR